MEFIQNIQTIIDLIKDNPYLSSIIGVAFSGALGTGVFSFLRRPQKASKEKMPHYFRDSDLIPLPTKRPAYSDRTAYVMAELSGLAYFKFEDANNTIIDAVDQVKKLDIENDEEIKKFLESFSLGIIENQNLNIDFLTKYLKKSGFELIETINVGGTQGFACKCDKAGESPYVVIVFRGTEKKIEDWLTDADARPTFLDKDKVKVEGKYKDKGYSKVHTGFFKAFTEIKDDDNKTTYDRVKEIMNSEAVKDDNDNPLPLFFTGHSLGGALALLATNLLALDIKGACYTFGAPRIGNFEFFSKLKTPVYRVVNSSDIVPRVPPGAIMTVILGLIKLMSWLTKLVPVISAGFEKLESILDKLKGYRHTGDLRYLTDVAANRFNQVRLLSNPPAIDRIMWMWQHLAADLFFPVSAHSISVYRRKLFHIAVQRRSSPAPAQSAASSASVQP